MYIYIYLIYLYIDNSQLLMISMIIYHIISIGWTSYGSNYCHSPGFRAGHASWLDNEAFWGFKYLGSINLMELLIYIFEIESAKLLLVESLKSITLQHYEEIITDIY